MKPTSAVIPCPTNFYPGAISPWEQPYYGWFSHHPMPEKLELSDVSFKSGYSVRCLEPTMRYALGYQFRDSRELVADLEFQAIVPPVPHVQGAPPFVGSSHYDQPGRLTGTLESRGWSSVSSVTPRRSRKPR